MTDAENDNEIKVVLSIDEGMDLLATGFRKAVCNLKMAQLQNDYLERINYGQGVMRVI